MASVSDELVDLNNKPETSSDRYFIGRRILWSESNEQTGVITFESLEAARQAWMDHNVDCHTWYIGKCSEKPGVTLYYN